MATFNLTIGTRVDYRTRTSGDYQSGTIAAIYPAGAPGDIYGHIGNGGTVAIKRDGYRETVMLPMHKATDADYVNADAPTNDDGLTFAQWRAAVDRIVRRACGLSSDDFADAPYWDSWADGLKPAEMLEVIADYDEVAAAILAEIEL